MKILTRFIILSFLVFFFDSCGKTPKSTLISADEWWLADTKETNDVSNLKGIRFTDSAIIVFDNNVYPIKWIDDKTFIINSQDVVVNIRKISNGNIELAFLSKNENFPRNDEDWDVLRKENRELEVSKKKESEKVNGYYNVYGNKIPIEKVPPAGIYVCDFGDAIKVFIQKGNVKFQAGKSKNTLKDVHVTNVMEGDGLQFALGEYPTCVYRGNGIISMSGYYFYGNSRDDDVEFKLTSQDNTTFNANPFVSAINVASNVGFIFKDEVKSGVLITKRCTITRKNTGIAFDIPKGKMWTPIYYEVESSNNNCMYTNIPRIYTERYNTGWDNSKSYFFPDKDDFVSFKVSLRNNRAIAGEFAVGIMWHEFVCSSVTYLFYFIEE